MSNSAIWPIDWTIRCYHSGSEWTWEWWQWRSTLRLPQSSRIIKASTSDCLVSYSGLSLGESRPHPAEMQSVYSAASTDWAIQDSRLGSLTPLRICSRCILQPQPTGPSRTLVGGVLLLCRYAVGVFCCPNRLGYPGLSLGESYSSADMQSVYSAAPVDWAIKL